MINVDQGLQTTAKTGFYSEWDKERWLRYGGRRVSWSDLGFEFCPEEAVLSEKWVEIKSEAKRQEAITIFPEQMVRSGKFWCFGGRVRCICYLKRKENEILKMFIAFGLRNFNNGAVIYWDVRIGTTGLEASLIGRGGCWTDDFEMHLYLIYWRASK